jgi:hypothetical protein
MRTQILKGLGAAGLVGVLAVLSVPAQAADVKVQVPFEFTVNARALPRGTYTVSSQGAGTVIVRGFSGGGAIVLTTRVSGKDNTPKLVFHRYGERYILREVWMGTTAGYALPEPRLEREAMRAARDERASARLEQVAIPLK